MNRGPGALVVLAALAFAGCAGLRPDADLPPVSRNAAVIALVDSARADTAAGKNANAGAHIERALGIEPRNALLWHELAKLRLAQGEYDQAVAVASKSNAWAGEDRRLQAANWRVIGEAHTRRGDSTSAQAATRRAEELER